MSEYFSLAIGFVILYVIECAQFVSPRSILLRSYGLSHCRVKAAGDQFLVADKCLALTTLFAPWGQNYFLTSASPGTVAKSSVNRTRITEQWHLFMKRTQLLRVLCTMLFLLSIVLLTQAIYPLLPVNALFAVLLLVVTSLAAISISAFLLMRSLFPERCAARWGLAIKCLFYPPSAIRVIDQISGYYWTEENPIEVALNIGNSDDLAPILAREIRELRFPVANEITLSDADRTARLNELEALVNEHQLSIQKYLRPHNGDLKEGAHYCPRCLQLYDHASGQCTDCAGVTTVAS